MTQIYVFYVCPNRQISAKRLSYNCRYLDDICTVNLKDFDTISNDIYDNTLILEGSTCSYKRDNFLDLYIRVIDGKFVTGIYHKVDDFNFEVISYPFPDCNIHSSLGYSTFYSQLIRFHRLYNNKSDLKFRAKLICQKQGLPYIPRVHLSEGSLVRSPLKWLWSEEPMVRRSFIPKFLFSESCYVPKIPYSERPSTIWILCCAGSLVRSSSSPKGAMFRTSVFRKSPLPHTGSILRRTFSPKFPQL